GEIAGVITGLKVGRNAVWGGDRDGRHVVLESACLVVGQDEGGRFPGGAVHQRVNDLFYLLGAALDAETGMRMLIEAAAKMRGALDKDDLRELAVSICAREDGVVLGDVAHLA